MERLIIFGAGGNGLRYSNDVLARGKDGIVCFLDNSKVKHGTKVNGIDVFSPERIGELEYTAVVVAVSAGFENDIVRQLRELGVDEAKIHILPDYFWGGAVRAQWLSDFAKMTYSRQTTGNVAEAGVFRGDFAKHIK